MDRMNAIEKEKKMPYVTSVERLAREEGIEQGIEKGVVLGQIQLLAQLVGADVPNLLELQDKSLSELKTLLVELNRKFKDRN